MPTLISLAYLAASILFIVGIQRLSSPKTASTGNLLAAVGMGIAIVATLLHQEVVSYAGITLGVAVGAIFGVIAATRVQQPNRHLCVALCCYRLRSIDRVEQWGHPQRSKP